MDLTERDNLLIWHPYTQHKRENIPIAIKKAQGSYLYDFNDKQYLDLISSWWVNIHGHGHPQIAQSIYEQALNLEHVIFAGFTHEPAVQLCELLKNYLPQELTKFFFSDNGSTSTEIALKMAYQYWNNKNKPEKTLFISFQGGYHGDTFGAMAVGASSGYHNIFHDFLFKVLTIPFPETWENDQELFNKEQHSLEILTQYLNSYSKTIAAIIIEPLVQGASGMRMCRPEYLQKVLKLIRSHDILIIFDEVMTGFGRTGTIFALDQINCVPDFLCLSKGITGGFLPLGLTVTTENIYKNFLNSGENYGFAHGHSYTANPLACAAAITSFKLLISPTTHAAIKNINNAHIKGTNYLKSVNPQITNVRVLGTIAAFDISQNTDISSFHSLKSKFLAKGLLLRPLGRTIYLLPPYSVTENELETAYQIIHKILYDI